MSIQTIGQICTGLVVTAIAALTLWGSLDVTAPIRPLLSKIGKAVLRPAKWCFNKIESLAEFLEATYGDNSFYMALLIILCISVIVGVGLGMVEAIFEALF